MRRDAITKPFGRIYGSLEHPSYITPEGPVWMWRKGQKVRFYTAEGVQVGPEQANVAPAVCAALAAGWIDVDFYLAIRSGLMVMTAAGDSTEVR